MCNQYREGVIPEGLFYITEGLCELYHEPKERKLIADADFADALDDDDDEDDDEDNDSVYISSCVGMEEEYNRALLRGGGGSPSLQGGRSFRASPGSSCTAIGGGGGGLTARTSDVRLLQRSGSSMRRASANASQSSYGAGNGGNLGAGVGGISSKAISLHASELTCGESRTLPSLPQSPTYSGVAHAGANGTRTGANGAIELSVIGMDAVIDGVVRAADAARYSSSRASDAHGSSSHAADRSSGSRATDARSSSSCKIDLVSSSSHVEAAGSSSRAAEENGGRSRAVENGGSSTHAEGDSSSRDAAGDDASSEKALRKGMSISGHALLPMAQSGVAKWAAGSGLGKSFPAISLPQHALVSHRTIGSSSGQCCTCSMQELQRWF